MSGGKSAWLLISFCVYIVLINARDHFGYVCAVIFVLFSAVLVVCDIFLEYCYRCIGMLLSPLLCCIL